MIFTKTNKKFNNYLHNQFFSCIFVPDFGVLHKCAKIKSKLTQGCLRCLYSITLAFVGWGLQTYKKAFNRTLFLVD